MAEPTDLHMIQLRFHAARYHRLAARVDDAGYGAHIVLKGLFGSAAPQPFCFKQREEATILGYARQPIEALRAIADAAAEPAFVQACDWSASASKPMPSAWSVGQRFGFETLVCPIRRVRAGGRGGERAEIDAWLAARRELPPDAPAPSREAVYDAWLRAQLDRQSGVRLESVSLTREARTHVARKAHAKGRRRRMERPLASFRGILEVTDPAAFGALLARGIGRHRAFGFGMVLLSPC